MKFSGRKPYLIWKLSLPVRGAWIEISPARAMKALTWRRSPCGERGLKCLNPSPPRAAVPVAPRAGSVD